MDAVSKVWMEYADPKTGLVQRRVEVRERRMSDRFIKTVYVMIGKYFNAAKKNSAIRGRNVLIYDTYRTLLCWWFKGVGSLPVKELILRVGLLDNNTRGWDQRYIKLNEAETAKKLIKYLENYASLAVESRHDENYYCTFRNIL